MSSRNFTCPNEGQKPLASLTVTAKSANPFAIESNPKLLFGAACGEMVSFLLAPPPLFTLCYPCCYVPFQDKLVFQRTERIQSSCFYVSPDFFLGAWCMDLGTSSAGLSSCFLLLERFSNESEHIQLQGYLDNVKHTV